MLAVSTLKRKPLIGMTLNMAIDFGFKRVKDQGHSSFSLLMRRLATTNKDIDIKS